MSAGSGEPDSLSKRDKLIELTKNSIAKVKELKPTSNSLEEGSRGPPEFKLVERDDELEGNPAFNTRALRERVRGNEREKKIHTSEVVKNVGRNILRPKQAVKNQATKVTATKLSMAERSFLSQDADLDLLRAHDSLQRVQAEASSMDSRQSSYSKIEPIDQCRRRVEGLENERESLRVAWINSHQVFRVRVVPSTPFQAPDISEISAEIADGRWVKDVLRFLGRGLLFYFQSFCTVYVDEVGEPQFSLATLQYNVERLLIASAAWQSWLYDIRTVYRWENPLRTGRWLAIFIVLWYTEHIGGFLYGYILYIVIKNRFAPTSIQSIRDSIDRAADSKTRATRFVELIDKHGAHGWIDAVVEEMGPSLQMIVVDLGNYVEILANFYEWKAPYRTLATLLFFASCLAVTLFADMAFCVKVVWFVAVRKPFLCRKDMQADTDGRKGGTFFLLWPIASLYPQYRALVSPVIWVFWEIPTHAEWAFQYLRSHAQDLREEIVKERGGSDVLEAAPLVGEALPDSQIRAEEIGSSDDDSIIFTDTRGVDDSPLDEDIRSFRAFEGKAPGRLILSTNAIRFVSKVTRAVEWRLPFIELAMMWKAESKITSMIGSARGQLVIRDISGLTRQLDGIRERDDAFNNIIAFSGLRWQNLQPR